MAVITAGLAGGIEVVYFLDLIAHAEGTSTSHITRDNGYDIVVSGVGGPERFDDYSDHPFKGGRVPKVIRRVPLLLSSAAGRYQLLYRYWRLYRESLKLPDFSPISQDYVAIQQIKERKAMVPIMDGDLIEAVTRCSSIWASLPGNNYGQGGKTMEALLDKYLEFADAPKEA